MTEQIFNDIPFVTAHDIHFRKLLYTPSEALRESRFFFNDILGSFGVFAIFWQLVPPSVSKISHGACFT